MKPAILPVIVLLAIVTHSAAAATPESAVASSPPVDSGSVLQVLLGLVIVLLVIGGVAWVLRHVLRLQPTMSGQLRILGGLSMGPRERVVLLKVGETQLLLGVAPGRVHTLHVLEKPLVETGSESLLTNSFTAQLSRAINRARGARSDA